MTHDDDDRPLLHVMSRSEITRRDALKLVGAGIAAAQAGCLPRPGEEIAPTVERPELAPGVPAYYATSIVEDGFAVGVLAESHGGRPTKIEGNPAHPASLGATTAQHQAAVFDLYDPYRVRGIRARGMPATWQRLRAELDADAGPLWLVMPPQSSPTLAALLARVRERRPGTRVVWHEPIDHRSAYQGTVLAFGAPLEQQLALDRARVLVALDADPLGTMPMACRWARDFARVHRPARSGDEVARLYVAEPMMTPTGSLADARLAIRAGDITALAALLLMELGADLPLPALPRGVVELATRALAAAGDGARAWIRALARELERHRGQVAIVVGDRQPPVVHAIAHHLLVATGSVGADGVGRPVHYTAPARLEPLGDAQLEELGAAARAAQVGTLVVSECNPVYTAPPRLDLGDAIDRVGRSFHHTLHHDETSARCAWTVGAAHTLERWGDARAFDGTVSFVQPLILPLHDGHGVLEVLATLAGVHAPEDRWLVRAQWQAPALATEEAWRAALAAGLLPDTAFAPVAVQPRDPAMLVAALDVALVPAATVAPGLYEIDLGPSPVIHDGRHASNAWLQELPRPVTKETWGNAAHLAPATASALGVRDGDELALTHRGRTVTVPALVVPDHAVGVISLDLGYGHATPDVPLADQLGGNGFVLRGDRGDCVVRGAVRTTGRTRPLRRTQEHFDQHHRDLAPVLTRAAWQHEPGALDHLRGPLPTLLGPQDREAPQWAMTIDTTICTGCSSCVVACQAENNIPVVGPEAVERGRDMHWLRIDTYRTEQGLVNQPMLCQHCEHAPCEYVCPVYATVHSPDGLNEMVYNRCVGTRFCSNNCPYKVRRFNWFAYDEPVTTLALQRNPDVTVRSRGVMEKCTYCVQRIRGAEIEARVAKRAIRPGEVVTACQQACPTGAIQFGALHHGETAMVQWRDSSRRYEVLHELGTRPRTQYLARIVDPPEDV